MDDESKIFCLRRKFAEIFGGEARIYRAPKSLTLIGNDLADGLLVTVPIDRYLWSAIRVQNDSEIRFHSTTFSNARDAEIAELEGDPCVEHIREVLLAIRSAENDPTGLDILISDDSPIQWSKGSSAAAESLAAFALLDQCVFSVGALNLSEVFRGHVTASRLSAPNGQKGNAMVLDGDSLEYELIGLPKDVSVVICDPTPKRESGEGKCDARNAELEEAVRILTGHGHKNGSLRDVPMAELELRRSELPEKAFWYCRHIISENERVQKFASALSFGDLAALGNLMYESHRSLREDLEVSSPELNLMVQIASMQDGIIGARLTGGSFEGCTVNLVRTGSTGQFIREVTQKYKALTRLQPNVYACSVVGGVECVENKALAMVE